MTGARPDHAPAGARGAAGDPGAYRVSMPVDWRALHIVLLVLALAIVAGSVGLLIDIRLGWGAGYAAMLAVYAVVALLLAVGILGRLVWFDVRSEAFWVVRWHGRRRVEWSAVEAVSPLGGSRRGLARWGASPDVRRLRYRDGHGRSATAEILPAMRDRARFVERLAQAIASGA